MIDPKKEIFSHCLYRQHCTKIESNFSKDLNKLGRDMKNIILLDVFFYLSENCKRILKNVLNLCQLMGF